MSIIDQLKSNEQANLAKARTRYLAVLQDIDHADAKELTTLLDTLGYTVSQCQDHAKVIGQIKGWQAIACQYQQWEDTSVRVEAENKARLERHAVEASECIARINQANSMLMNCLNASKAIEELKAKNSQLFSQVP